MCNCNFSLTPILARIHLSWLIHSHEHNTQVGSLKWKESLMIKYTGLSMLHRTRGSASCDLDAKAALSRLHTAGFFYQIPGMSSSRTAGCFVSKTENRQCNTRSSIWVIHLWRRSTPAVNDFNFPPLFFSSRLLIGCLVTLKEFSEWLEGF